MSVEDTMPSSPLGLPVWSAGDVQSVAIRHEALLMSQAGGDHRQAVLAALGILLSHRLIGSDDFTALSELVTQMEGDRPDPDRVIGLYDKLVLGGEASPVAVALVGIAREQLKAESAWNKLVGKTVIGAVTGMFVGEGAAIPCWGLLPERQRVLPS